MISQRRERMPQAVSSYLLHTCTGASLVNQLGNIVRRIRDHAPRPILRRHSFESLPQLRYHDRHRPRARCGLVSFLRHELVKLVLHDSPGNTDRPGGKVDIVPRHSKQLRPAERVQREQDRKRGRRATAAAMSGGICSGSSHCRWFVFNGGKVTLGAFMPFSPNTDTINRKAFLSVLGEHRSASALQTACQSVFTSSGRPMTEENQFF